MNQERGKMEAVAAHSQWDGQKGERKLSEVANGRRESLSNLSSAFKLKVFLNVWWQAATLFIYFYIDRADIQYFTYIYYS
jgi:hypothetical protein